MSHSTGLTITNPLVLYRTLLTTKRIQADPAQHRLALHLQNLYHRLKDYKPEVDFRHRLNQLDKFVKKPDVSSFDLANGLSKQEGRRWTGLLETFQGEGVQPKQSRALTRRLTDHESALQLDSPRGLLLYGEVGTGKSLLVDLLADSLPTPNKRRWHFNTFMLEVFAKLEQLRRNRQNPSSYLDSCSAEHSLLQLARDMISTSPILFLDEFQLPDRAASKILSNLFISFFHLGGVLVATSNRMPEELARASGTEFGVSSSNRHSLSGRRLKIPNANSEDGTSANMPAGKGDFSAFLDVLKARCEIWEMEGDKDWRRQDIAEVSSERRIKNRNDANVDGFYGCEPLIPGNLGLGYEQSLQIEPQIDTATEKKSSNAVSRLKHYFIRPSKLANHDNELSPVWQSSEFSSVHGLGSQKQHPDEQISWESTALRVYGRSLQVPRHLEGVSKWTFVELCGSNLGPADYVTLASTFHTFILTEVPILTTLLKNEARRLITLLDALYEARCKLLLSAEAGPDELFFPVEPQQAFSASSRTVRPTDAATKNSGEVYTPPRGDDSVYAETISEIYQDSTSPFRPNTASYSSSASPPSYAASAFPTSASQLSTARSILADEDSDFGPAHGAGFRHGMSDGSPGAGNEIGRQVDFGNAGAFVGEDEKFAYKRARSRLWELCSARWWEREGDWWRPLPREARRWENSREETLLMSSAPERDSMAPKSNDERLFRHGSSLFRTSEVAPPRFSWVHAWGMMAWGKKAGDWGKGPGFFREQGRKDGKIEREEKEKD